MKKRFPFTGLLLVLFAALAIHNVWTQTQTVSVLSYAEFEKALDEGKVKEVMVDDDQLRGTYKEPVEGKTAFVTVRVDKDIAEKLARAGVDYQGVVSSRWLEAILSWVLPLALMVGVWIWISRRMMGGRDGFMSIGKSKAKVYVESDTKVRFDDVAGVDEAKAELREVVEFLKDPSRYGRLGARMPKGVLLVGPPGTGKTLLAKAVAGEAGVSFFSISGSEFVEMFVGVGAARVRDLFEQARQKAPCIIFIDELDALGRARANGSGFGGHDEKEQTLNQLLVELDGFDPSAGIVLLGATNRPEILDPALLRAGRFDRQVLVDRPDRIGRADVLRVHTRKVKLAPNTNLDAVAALTPGFTGADLANLVNEAALTATRRGADEITEPDFTKAIERIVAGLERRNRLLNPREREIVAYHEMGHALVAAGVRSTDRAQKVSIIPRGIGALGYTIHRPTEDRYLMTAEELDDKIAVLLGGRAAEHVIFGHLSTGAADDLQRATEIARSMVTRYGMNPELGSVAYDEERTSFLGGPAAMGMTQRRYSEETAREIDEAIRQIVQKAFERARVILVTNRDLLESSSRGLLETETLEDPVLSGLLDQVRPPA
jgi:cell division protease FtsH